MVGGDNNNVVTVGGSSLIGVDYSNPQQPVLDGAHHNNIVNFGGDVATNQTQTLADDGELSVSACGTNLSGQAARITTSAIPGGC